MAVKRTASPEEIVKALNSAISQLDALDGDCRECRVRRISRVTYGEEKQLDRNWNVDMVNGECGGECRAILEDIARAVGKELDAFWS